jgi:hypothetical protein
LPSASPEDLRIRRVTLWILATGFVAAAGAWVAAAARPANPLAEQLESKKYLHDLEVYGGKANVLAAEFREWFSGLWSGKNLAYTIVVLTVLTVLVYRFFAAPLPADDDGPPNGEPPRPWPPPR